MKDLLKQAEAIKDEIVGIRRDIHRHPELGRKEFRTSEIIRNKMEEYGVDSYDSLTPTSVVADIRGTKPGTDEEKERCVALRTDIDALPVTENTGLTYASEVPGVMHACGHDMQCSMMIGNAKLLCGLRDKFSGTVRLIFQHSEDTLPGGAKELVNMGVMEGVDAIFGMHVHPSENDRIGTIMTKPGPFMTSADVYNFDIWGTGGHGSAPQKATDPILAAAQMIDMFQNIQSRDVKPGDTAIYMMNQIDGGVASNIITDHVRMSGNARAYSKEARDKIEEMTYRVAKAVAQLSDCRIDVDEHLGYDPVNNDEELFEVLKAATEKYIGPDKVDQLKEPTGGSEDFSFYSTLTGVPEVFTYIEAGHIGNLSSLHSADCAMNEDVFPYGMAVMTGTALDYLNGAASTR